MPDDVRHNIERSRYEITREGGTAFAEYERRGDLIVATHTVTPAALRGQGLAGQLVRAMLARARSGTEGGPGVQLRRGLFRQPPGRTGSARRLRAVRIWPL